MKAWLPVSSWLNKRNDIVVQAFQYLEAQVGAEPLEKAINKYAENNKIDNIKPSSFFDLLIPGDGNYLSISYDKDIKSLKIMFENMPTTKQMIGDIILSEKV